PSDRPAARRRMWRTIEQLRHEGVTILLVRHAMDEVEKLCDRIVLIDAGRILTIGTPTDIVAETGAATLEDAFVALTGQELHEMESCAGTPPPRPLPRPRPLPSGRIGPACAPC